VELACFPGQLENAGSKTVACGVPSLMMNAEIIQIGELLIAARSCPFGGILDDLYLAKVFSYARCDRGSFSSFLDQAPPSAADLIGFRRAGMPRTI
jgi:hypothetical protein